MGSEKLEPVLPAEIKEDVHKLKGDKIYEIFKFVRGIVTHQFRFGIKGGIKGFIFYGPVGTGKTVLAKALAKDLALDLYFVDGSHIARGLYGESEQQINKIFDEATRRKAVILIDDAESVFPKRDWIRGQSWHVAQNNVFFHKLDDFDPSKGIVILTTNRYDMLDAAVKDRLLPIEFPSPDIETVIAAARERCEELGINSSDVEARLRENKDKSISFRAVEKLVIQEYIKQIASLPDIRKRNASEKECHSS